MEIQQIALGNGVQRSASVPGSPIVEVLLGTEADSPLGVISVTVPAGGGMPEHDHGPSTVVLIPQSGSAHLVDVADDERVIELPLGTLTTIPVGRRVRLENPGSVDAHLLVALSPPDFARQIAKWPEAAEATA